LHLLVYPSAIDLFTSALTFLTQRLAAHRAAIGSRWQKLPTGRQALLVLAHLRHGDTYARLAAGFGIGLSTTYRYVREAVGLLTAAGRSLTAALGAGLDAQQLRPALRHAGAHHPDPRRRSAVLLRQAHPPRSQPAPADRPARPADLDVATGGPAGPTT
jgi:hypothetical protein